MTPEQVRAAMPPDMLAVCEAVKSRFPGMRLLHLETPTLTLGRDVVGALAGAIAPARHGARRAHGLPVREVRRGVFL